MRMTSRLMDKMYRLPSHQPTWTSVMNICRYTWCLQCPQCPHPSLSRRAALRGSSATLSYQTGLGLNGPSLRKPRLAALQQRTLATDSRACLMPGHPAYLSVAKAFPGISFPPYFRSHKRWLNLSSYCLDSSQKTDQGKERAALRQYGRTYTAAKKYTQRSVAEQDEQELEHFPDDLKPEDTFGTLTSKHDQKLHSSRDAFDLQEDSDDERDGEGIRPPARRNSPVWYANQMKKLIKEGKLMEAIAMLETRMLKEDRVQPTEIHYNTLIGACGREGYTKKAFKLYNQMKKQGLSPSDVTYTGLFNSCAESPWPLTDGLTRLRHLHSQLREKGVQANRIAQHAMIKAYSKCGDLPVAFDLFRDLLASGAKLTSESFAFLLFACAGDKERGLVYGIEAWRQMIRRGIKPDIYTYNLLLRIARDCGIGDPELALRLLITEQNLQLPAPKEKARSAKGRRSSQPQEQGRRGESPDEVLRVITPLEVRDAEDQEEASDDLSDVGRELEAASGKALVRPREQLPNLLDRAPDVSHVHSLARVSSPSDRLALLGGAEGILGSMRDHGVTPDVKSLTLLMEILPMTTGDEERLLNVVDEHRVKVDVDFYNAIIRRRSRRADLKAAKAILPAIHKQGLFPNLRTFVNLACECSRAKDGIQLLKDMKEAGLKPTVHIYGALITAAARRQDYRYQTELLKCMEKDKVSPNERILQKLEATAAFGWNPYKADPSEWATRQQVRLNHFRGFYTQWLDRMGVQEAPHPWQKFHGPKGDQATS